MLELPTTAAAEAARVALAGSEKAHCIPSEKPSPCTGSPSNRAVMSKHAKDVPVALNHPVTLSVRIAMQSLLNKVFRLKTEALLAIRRTQSSALHRAEHLFASPSNVYALPPCCSNRTNLRSTGYPVTPGS